MRLLAIALRGATFRSLRRHRNYRLFFVGQIVSVAGTWMQNIALAWLVIELSGSPLAVGALAFCRFLPFLSSASSPASSSTASTRAGCSSSTQGGGDARLDRARRRDARRAWRRCRSSTRSRRSAASILVFDAPGRQTLTFQMVGPRELPNAVALNSGLFNASRVVGPAIAGLLIAAVGTGVCFVVNAVSFLAVLVALLPDARGRAVPGREAPETRVVAGIREGLRVGGRRRRSRAPCSSSSRSSASSGSTSTSSSRSSRRRRSTSGGGRSASSPRLRRSGRCRCARHREPARARARALRRRRGRVQPRDARARPRRHASRLALVLLFVLGLRFSLFTSSANALVQLASPAICAGG